MILEAKIFSNSPILTFPLFWILTALSAAVSILCVFSVMMHENILSYMMIVTFLQ